MTNQGAQLPTGTLREISAEEYEEAIAQWTPKLKKFAGMYFPYIDYDDGMQEAQIVLWKCMQRFSHDRGAIFHTYFHQALFNRAGALAKRPVKHNENPNQVVYLSEIFDESEDAPTYSAEKLALSFTVLPDIQFEAESVGFGGLEALIMASRAELVSELDTKMPKKLRRELNPADITDILTNLARQFEIDLHDLESADQRVEFKVNRLRGKLHDYANQDRI